MFIFQLNLLRILTYIHRCDKANLSQYKNILERWRQKMVDHLSERGDAWVKDGKLVIRQENIIFSPNYPLN